MKAEESSKATGQGKGNEMGKFTKTEKVVIRHLLKKGYHTAEGVREAQAIWKLAEKYSKLKVHVVDGDMEVWKKYNFGRDWKVTRVPSTSVTIYTPEAWKNL